MQTVQLFFLKIFSHLIPNACVQTFDVMFLVNFFLTKQGLYIGVVLLQKANSTTDTELNMISVALQLHMCKLTLIICFSGPNLMY